jgi:hypothetical protein
MAKERAKGEKIERENKLSTYLKKKGQHDLAQILSLCQHS